MRLDRNARALQTCRLIRESSKIQETHQRSGFGWIFRAMVLMIQTIRAWIYTSKIMRTVIVVLNTKKQKLRLHSCDYQIVDIY